MSKIIHLSDYKQCKHCKEVKPNTPEFFRLKAGNCCRVCESRLTQLRVKRYKRESLDGWRKRKAEYDRRHRQLHPDQIVARRRANYAYGNIRGYCEDCGEWHDHLHKHHPNHDAALKTIFLCPPCHGRADRKLRAAKKRRLAA